MRFVTQAVIPTQAGAATITGTVIIPADQLAFASIQGITTGTFTGTMNLQGSNDMPANITAEGQFTPTNWTLIPSATAAISAASTAITVPVTICYRWLRVTISSGTGAGNVTVNLTARSNT